jgi:hypothetical protein
MRGWALVAAALHTTIIGVMAFLMWFVATFPWENQSPEDAAADDWLVGAAPLMVGLAIAFAVAILVLRVPVAVAIGFVTAEFAVDAVVLRYALDNSDHSDGRLLLVALAAAVTGLVAVIVVRRTRDSLVVRTSQR